MSSLITNGIALLNEPDILQAKFLNQLVRHIDKSDLTLNDQNVQCSHTDLRHNDKYHSEVLTIFKQIRDWIRHHLAIELHGDSGYQLRKIHGTTNRHVDGVWDKYDTNFVRKVSCIIALNGNFGGGEISFPNQDFKYRMNKGDVLLFPPYWTHPHQVFPPHAGTFRYTINSWFLELPPNLETVPIDKEGMINIYD